MMIPTLPFYFVLLEQYYTGEMNFPPINGVDEGSLLYLVVCLITGYYGAEQLWTAEIEFMGQKWLRKDLFVGTLQVLLPNAALVAFYQIYRKQGNLQFKRLWDANYFVCQIIFWFVSFGTFLLASVYSPSEIWRTHSRAVQLAHGL